MDDQLIIKSFRIIRIEYCFWKIYFFKLKIWLASKINKKNNLKLLKKLTIGKIRYIDYLLSSYSIPTVNLFFLIFTSKCIYRCNYNFRIGSRQYLVTKKKKKRIKNRILSSFRLIIPRRWKKNVCSGQKFELTERTIIRLLILPSSCSPNSFRTEWNLIWN